MRRNRPPRRKSRPIRRARALRRSPPEPNQQAMPHTYPQHVLLAEDNETNALLVLSALERTGATVDWARDGDEAVSLVEQSFANRRPPYDVVLMDLRMPKLDGMEATRQIRALEERFCRKEAVRIVAVTANAMKRDRTAARNRRNRRVSSKAIPGPGAPRPPWPASAGNREGHLIRRYLFRYRLSRTVRGLWSSRSQGGIRERFRQS